MASADNKTSRGESVALSNVSRRFGNLLAVDGVSVDIPAGSFFSLLGPSGCGKSTTLRIIAGFEVPDSGQVFIGNKDVTMLDARHRPTVMVFQNYALFPHMTVGENVEYGLKIRKMSATDRKRKVSEALNRVDMEAFATTSVTSLSGGQQQRVALARAVAIEPDVILFDEPLSNLDVALRQQTRVELKMLQKRLGLTSVYVTHDQEEALALSDQIAVMRNGSIVQVGAPRDLYTEPKTAFVASFLGGSNVITDAQLAAELTGLRPGVNEAVAFRSEHVSIHPEGQFEGEVVARQFLGMITEIELSVKGQTITAKSIQAIPNEATLRFDITSSRLVENDL